jgi:CheY-like chemotaxis protein
MSAETRNRIFEPFFTTKPVGRGSGLGLAVADGVIRGHGGAIEVETALGAGSSFALYLPAGPPVPTAASAAKAELPKASVGGGRRVLLVDDDSMVLGILTRILGRAGYRVASHGDPVAALAALEASPDGFDLLMTDRAMPGLSGPEVAARAWGLNPGLPVMLLTGADQPADLESSRFSAVVVKPVDSRTLLRVVERVLAGDPGPVPAPAA